MQISISFVPIKWGDRCEFEIFSTRNLYKIVAVFSNVNILFEKKYKADKGPISSRLAQVNSSLVAWKCNIFQKYNWILFNVYLKQTSWWEKEAIHKLWSQKCVEKICSKTLSTIFFLVDSFFYSMGKSCTTTYVENRLLILYCYSNYTFWYLGTFVDIFL